jgi:hypothetical protein
MTLAERVDAALTRPPLSEISAPARAELLESLATASDLADLPGRWQAAILSAEGARPAEHGCCSAA